MIELVGSGECEETCDDLADNDGDGLRDCEDPSCAESAHCHPPVCDDNTDNDQDGRIDCGDAQCAEIPRGQEHLHCRDDFDNDQDGLVDCADPNCEDDPHCRVLSFVRGDANGDGRINVMDALTLLRFVVGGGEQGRDCFEAMDTNDDDSIGLTDALPVLRWLFLDGPPLPPPFPACGEASMATCIRTTPGC